MKPVTELIEEKNGYKEQCEIFASILEHALALGCFTPGGSTEGWAKEELKEFESLNLRFKNLRDSRKTSRESNQ